jgi:hypothetical protein
MVSHAAHPLLHLIGVHRLGRDRMGVFTGDKDKSKIKQFMNSYVQPGTFSLRHAQNPQKNPLRSDHRLRAIAICHVGDAIAAQNNTNLQYCSKRRFGVLPVRTF